MKRVSIIVTAILTLGIAVPASAQVTEQGQPYCIDYETTLTANWNVLTGALLGIDPSSNIDFVGGVTTTAPVGSTPALVARISLDFPPREVVSVQIYAGASDTTQLGQPVRFLQASTIYNEKIVTSDRAVFRPGYEEKTIYFEPGFYTESLLVMHWLTNPASGASLVLGIGNVCFRSALGTPTPFGTPRPATATGTPPPTRTPTTGPSPTPTRTPTTGPSLTNTAGGPTSTNIPPSGTPSGEGQSTLENNEFPGRPAPDPSCTDILDPCPIFPIPQLPGSGIISPTGLAAMNTLTPLPSMTRRGIGPPGGTPTGTGTSGTGVPGTYPPPPLATQVAAAVDVLSEPGELVIYGPGGTPVDMRQGVYETGQRIGAFIGLARGVANADVGRGGQLIIFIIFLITLNLLVRATLFVIPIAYTTIRFIVQVIDVIVPFTLVFFLILPAPRTAHAQPPTNTPAPTRTWTPYPTYTPLSTLRPVQPSPTSEYAGLRPTPTPLVVNANPTVRAAFDTRGATGQLADSIINIYRAINTYFIADIVSFVAVVIVCLWLLVRTYGYLSRTND
jgi:hypothetical protein